MGPNGGVGLDTIHHHPQVQFVGRIGRARHRDVVELPNWISDRPRGALLHDRFPGQGLAHLLIPGPVERQSGRLPLHRHREPRAVFEKRDGNIGMRALCYRFTGTCCIMRPDDLDAGVHGIDAAGSHPTGHILLGKIGPGVGAVCPNAGSRLGARHPDHEIELVSRIVGLAHVYVVQLPERERLTIDAALLGYS